MKTIILSILLAIMVWGIYYSCKYIFDKSIKTADELKGTYQLSIIGVLESNKKKVTKIDALHKKLKQPADSLAYVVGAIQSLNIDKIGIASNDEETAAIAENMKTQLSNVECSSFISKDVDALKAMKEVGNEILFVKLNHTSKDDLKNELSTCVLQGIKVLGVIVVD